MKIITYECDRCGARVETAYMMMFGNDKKSYPETESDELDFCSDCVHEIAAFAAKKIRKAKMAKMEETALHVPEFVEKPQKTEVKSTKRKKKEEQPAREPVIREGKAVALRKAGWSFAMIAEEMSCTTERIEEWFADYECRHGEIVANGKTEKPLEKWCKGEPDEISMQTAQID